jgi:DNA repair exonuclease SbcCD ATPase subunit
MGYLDRIYEQTSEQPSFRSEVTEAVVRFPGMPKGYGAVLDLVSQAAEAVRNIENSASEAERTSYQKIELAEKRIAELEGELRSAQICIGEARHKLKEADDAARTDKSRLETAERKICELEMRARTAEAQAKENANALARIEEAIRTKLLEKRIPAHTARLNAN